MYTIKQASARSGVPEALLRAWERRYGVVTPSRTASGYRVYDTPAIARLQAMRRLIADGWSAGVAAARLAETDDAAVRELLGEGRSTEADAEARQPSVSTAVAAELVAAARALDERSIEGVLDDMFARGTFESVVETFVHPSLVAVGEAWADGSLSVAGEHAVAVAVGRRLGAAFLAAGLPPESAGAVLVGLPPGARHELGALAFATAARRAGMAVRYLGADLPIEDWLAAANRTEAAAVVIGVTLGRDVAPARRVAEALHGARPSLVVAFGGPAAARAAGHVATPDVVLPDGLRDAVAAMAEALDAAGPAHPAS